MSDDAWFETEEPTRLGLIREAQRIRERTRVRPFRVIALALAMTSLISWKVITRKHMVEAEVVLLMKEGALAAKHNAIPFDELKEYVANVLLPNKELTKLIEDHHLFRLRAAFGADDAVKELRENIEIEIWKNSFVYYDEDAESVEHSARIGITYTDTDPDRAMEVAHDLGEIVIALSRDKRQTLNDQLAQGISDMRDELEAKLTNLTVERAEKDQARLLAEHDGKADLAQALALDMRSMDGEMKDLQKELSDIAGSRDLIADRIAKSGLDMQLGIVEERPPERPEHHNFAVAMILIVVGIFSFLGSALLIGAFDSRVHDTDDVERLGLPVLGHVPGFPGDGVGSLQVRGASRRRVPSFRRWRSHQ